MKEPNTDDPINIVGAGIFGLSTAIALAQRGFKNVTVFDKHPYDETQYSYFKGADAASADINKIIRSAYGGVSIYSELTLEAIEEWKAWNADLANGKTVPPGMTKDDRVAIFHGNLIMTDAPNLSAFDQATVDSTEAAGYPDTQLVLSNPGHRHLARAKGFDFALDPFRREVKGMANTAVLDTTGGTAIADKACRFALQRARELGVSFILHPVHGALKDLIRSSSSSPVTGITTADNLVHPAAVTILATGSYTPSLVPSLDHLCEATAGTVALYRIPRSSHLWHRLAPERFPSWQWKMRGGADAGLYGFGRDGDGWFKIGYRGTKYTNPLIQGDGKERSEPVTAWTADGEGKKAVAVPRKGVEVIEKFVRTHLPELGAEGIKMERTRLCWYTDSYDNHLVIDWVPGSCGSLMVATGGSGHAFKYLPVIGRYVADMMMGRGLEREALNAWRWRESSIDGEQTNVLMEGSGGKRALGNVEMVELRRRGEEGGKWARL